VCFFFIRSDILSCSEGDLHKDSTANARRKPFVRMHGLVYSLQAQRDYMNMHK